RPHRLGPALCNGAAVRPTNPMTPTDVQEEPMSLTTTSTSSTEALPGLKGKGVLVTGGTSGIGQAIAVKFAEYGVNVAINYLRQPDEATDTSEQVHACVNKVQQAGVRDVLVQGDVSDEDQVVAM